MYEFDPDGGPPPAKMYADLKRALAELSAKLSGTGLRLIDCGRMKGWRLAFEQGGGAYVA